MITNRIFMILHDGSKTMLASSYTYVVVLASRVPSIQDYENGDEMTYDAPVIRQSLAAQVRFTSSSSAENGIGIFIWKLWLLPHSQNKVKAPEKIAEAVVRVNQHTRGYRRACQRFIEDALDRHFRKVIIDHHAF